jgi:hypothetical protein
MSDDPGRDVVIFTDAVRLPAEQRAAFVGRACAGDKNLRRQAEMYQLTLRRLLKSSGYCITWRLHAAVG